jgi:hypothetical protein
LPGVTWGRQSPSALQDCAVWILHVPGSVGQSRLVLHAWWSLVHCWPTGPQFTSIVQLTPVCVLQWPASVGHAPMQGSFDDEQIPGTIEHSLSAWQLVLVVEQ